MGDPGCGPGVCALPVDSVSGNRVDRVHHFRMTIDPILRAARTDKICGSCLGA